MQAITNHLINLLSQRSLFKIKFRQYDGGEQVFWPLYKNAEILVNTGDIVAWLWGDSLKFGCVRTVQGEVVQVSMLARKKGKTLQTAFNNQQIVCIFMPE